MKRVLSGRTRKSAIAAAICVLIFVLTAAAGRVQASDGTEVVLPRPVAYVESYTVDGNLVAGEEIVIHFTVRNAGNVSPVDGLLLQLSCPSGAFFPSPNTTTQHYIGRIRAGDTALVAARMTAKDALSNGTYDIAYSLSYQMPDRETVFTGSGTIALTVKSDAMEIVEVTVPGEHSDGKLAYVSVRYANTGETELRNVRLLIDGNIGANEKMTDIGTVRAGAGGIAEKNVMFAGAGEQRLTFYLLYEDTNGHQITSDFYETTTNVSAAGALPSGGVAGGQTAPGTGTAGQLSGSEASQPAANGLTQFREFVMSMFGSPVFAVVAITLIAALCVVVIVRFFIKKRKS